MGWSEGLCRAVRKLPNPANSSSSPDGNLVCSDSAIVNLNAIT